MKPFLILQIRPETEAADNEYEAFLKFSNLKKEDTKRIRITKNTNLDINLDNYSGVILGGGPFNTSTEKENQSIEQLEVEKKLYNLMDKIVEKDFPFLGACYGIGILGTHQMCQISTEKYGEEVGAVEIKLTEDGKKDDLLKNLPENFYAFVGHKEACQVLADHTILLASSDTCPIEMFKVKNNIYATQFHPELDIEGIVLRIKIYKNHGYFKPEETENLIQKVSKIKVEYPGLILKNFVEKYKKN